MPPPSKPWQSKPPDDMLLTNVKIVDPVIGSLSGPKTVWLHDGKIQKVSDADDHAKADAMTKVDLTGTFLCPGLIDCHMHVTIPPSIGKVTEMFDAHPDTLAYRTAWGLKQTLLRGFTTVRDCAGANYALRDAVAEGLIQGPRLFVAGKALSQTGGHGDLRTQHEGDDFKCCGGHGPGFARICDGVPACLAAARDELRMGADFLKIMAGGGVASPVDPLEMLQFTPEEIRAITTSAANLGKYVTAHAYTNKAIRMAVENGVRGIEHGNFIDKETAEMCKEKGVFVTPTLVTYHAMTSEEFKDFLPESGRLKGREVLAYGVESLKILHKAGVTMVFGTDLICGQTRQNEEFRIRKEALPDVEILRAATINGAKRLGMEGKIGEVKEGAFADLLILDADPLEDILVLADVKKHCRAILKQGRVVMTELEKEGLVMDRSL